ncbi:glycogen/starch synthase [Shewanella sp. 1_MG-2023]|uniref:glycogen synthase n=1 Tax=unclassified Shewanella TaxID=196818 RepID=UPI0026E22038|nr:MULTISPECIES: glycogen/starch synthase [unclassified Shewanella]MDO6612402.1 glycogen/starch synthase [Shewanella sp. 7_MG-2023]MDO6772256.1 glycogen/starch synthase [Shewanella sp. 2_MG-2023]MDO6794162.1 glycogen/starch synthase [Shewanella sp. 1_MG-2023]
MIAAENDAIKGAKVGGMADVIRDLPPALAKVDVCVDVAMPNYGFIAKDNNAEFIAKVVVKFGANLETIDVYKMPAPFLTATDLQDKSTQDNSAQDTSSQGKSIELTSSVYLFDHHLFNSPDNQVYTEGAPDRPFAEDATKFALFNLVVAQAYIDAVIAPVDILHMHDWHAGMLVMLRAFASEYAALKALPCVFSIHNLALQGIRPIREDVSSFTAWFPELTMKLTQAQKTQISDPRYPHCINPMKMGIELSDKVHLVSPTYANEVLMASDHQNGFFGGEDLEGSLLDKHHRGDVVGILNGCIYETQATHDQLTQVNKVSKVAKSVKPVSSKQIAQVFEHSQQAVIKWIGKSEYVKAVDQIALTRLQMLMAKQSKPSVACDFLMTSVGRLTDQKVLLLRQANDNSGSILQSVLQRLKQAKPKAIFILLGSGDKQIAAEFQKVAANNDNFVFLNGYDDSLSTSLYQYGELFMMPSSFEPCGISQLLAMKHGQVCIAHGVGGLRDTIADKHNGWLFEGNNLQHQAQQLLLVLEQALTMHNDNPDEFSAMRQSASEVRFTWHKVAQEYLEKLYSS